MPGTENTVRIKAEFMGSNIFNSVMNKYVRNKKYTVKSGNISFDNHSKTKLPQRIIIDSDGKVNDIRGSEKRTVRDINDKSTKLSINYWSDGPPKIFAVQYKTPNVTPDDNDRAGEYTLFKYNLMGFTTFAAFGINIKDKILGEVGREMALFFNGLDCNSIYETNEPVIFFNNEDHEKIFNTFMKFFNKEEKSKKLFYSTDNTDNCKISADLNEQDKTNLRDIFKLKEGQGELPVDADFFYLIGDLSALTTSPFYTLTDFKTNNNKGSGHANMYFYNPLIKYLYLLINFIYKKFRSADDLNYFYICCNFFIYKFIKLIVDQGRNIVTTLEHLKFFFLSRVNDGIKNYNTDALSKETKQTKGNKAFLFENPEAALQKEKTYIIPTNYGTKSEPIVIEEKVNLGEFQKYQLLSMLQDLAGNQNNLKALDSITTDKGLYPNLMISPDPDKSSVKKIGAIFVMFTNIKAFIKNPDTYLLDNKDVKLRTELPKLCTAQFDTLEFAESISSTTLLKKPAEISNKGGARKAIKRNKRYLSTKHKSTLRKSLISRNHSIYSRKTKKFTK